MSDSLEWFQEEPVRGWQQRMQLRARLFEGQSEYQHLEIVDTVSFGRALVLDGALQTTEADEFIYHEMLVHLPLLHHPHPKRVLIVGGGDCGSLRRALQHPVERAVMVEIDDLVVSASREYLPSIGGDAVSDPRAELIIGDGMKFLDETTERFDVIMVDSTDPVGAGTVLMSSRFYAAARDALAPGGLLAIQSSSPLLQIDEFRDAYRNLAELLPGARAYLALVPSYPGVLWSFTLAARDGNVELPTLETLQARFAAAGLVTEYYTPELHLGAFALPVFVQAILDGGTHAGRHPIPGS